jgi:hypothetical protein
MKWLKLAGFALVTVALITTESTGPQRIFGKAPHHHISLYLYGTDDMNVGFGILRVAPISFYLDSHFTSKLGDLRWHGWGSGKASAAGNLYWLRQCNTDCKHPVR